MSTLVPRHILCALSASLLFSVPTTGQVDPSMLPAGSLRSYGLHLDLCQGNAHLVGDIQRLFC